MPETGAKLFPAINNALYFGTNPRHEEVEFARNDEHQIPNPTTPDSKVLQGSQNLFILVEATKHLASDFTGSKSLEEHFLREQSNLGDWGSEQDSPIYWAFHVAGRIAIASRTPNNSLRRLCIQSIASFLYRSKESLFGKEVLMAGMRGAGHEQSGSYELDYVINKLFGDKSLKPKNSWSNRSEKHDEGLNNYGWLLPQSDATWRILAEAATLANSSSFVSNWIRVQKRIIEGPGYKFVWVEEDINSNTPFIGLNGYSNHKKFTLPFNYYVHVRQQKSNGKINVGYSWSLSPTEGSKLSHLKWEYTGLYEKLRDGVGQKILLPITGQPTRYTIFGPDGVKNALGLVVSNESAPFIPTPTPEAPKPSGGIQRRKSLFGRFIDWIKRKIS